MKKVILLFVALLLFSSLSAYGDFPKLINYQGMLTQLDGTTPVNDGNYNLTFKIYGSAGGTDSLWRENHPSVQVTNGLFNVILGSVTTLNLPFNTSYWLGIRVGSDAELSPRIQLTSVGYAYRALIADTATVAVSAPTGGGWTDDGTVVRLQTSTDEVGIGTTDPDANLHIYENTNGFVGIHIENPNTGSGSAEGIYFVNEDGDMAAIRLYDDNSTYPSQMRIFNNRPNGSIHLSNTGGGITFTNNGNMGITTTNPQNKLDVEGAMVVGSTYSGSYTAPSNGMLVQGNVGIGTTSPDAKLEVYHTTSGEIARFKNTQTSGWIDFYEGAIVRGYLGFGDDNSLFTDQLGDALALRSQAALQLGSGTGSDLTILGSGNVGIGTTNPEANLHIYENTNGFVGLFIENPNTGSSSAEGIYFSNENGDMAAIRLYDDNSTYPSQMRIFNNRPSGSIHFLTSNGHVTLTNDGRVVCSELQLTGGSDIAEPFEMKEPNKIEPGMVVVIDPDNPGKLKVSIKAYDRCVAGIVSGAGGIKPGVRMMSDESFKNNHHVALTGRVYALCDASFGSIEPGDLLTTSPTSGYAMKVTDYQRAQGAILGKAMTKLDKGQGLVSVLVTLQ